MRNRSKKNIFANRTLASHINEDSLLYGNLLPSDERNKVDIYNINMIPTDAKKCQVVFDGKSVYAATKFYPGEIIEICPSRRINKSSLFSRDIRDLAFEIVENTEYVIPMGYCQYYDIDDYFNGEPNCDWEWDGKRSSVIIRAIRKMEKDEKLVLNIKE